MKRSDDRIRAEGDDQMHVLSMAPALWRCVKCEGDFAADGCGSMRWREDLAAHHRALRLALLMLVIMPAHTLKMIIDVPP